MFVPFPLGKYTVVQSIRYGGMGEVLLAEKIDETGNISRWAVKRPLPTIVEDPELLALFWKETELMQKLTQKAFPRVAEVGVAQGLPYVVMEYIPGSSVREILTAVREGRLQVRLETWVLMASELVTAVGQLHRFKKGDRMLVHGDISSANVMIDTTGEVRLLDLGLALVNDTHWRRIVRARERDLPAFLVTRDKNREFDTYSIAMLLVECLGGSAVLDENPRVPRELVHLLRKSTDSSGLYVFKSSRALKWELKSFLVQDKIAQMREELATAARRMHSEKAARDG